MLSVLIVDDEYEIREGLRNRFHWEDYNITEVFADYHIYQDEPHVWSGIP